MNTRSNVGQGSTQGNNAQSGNSGGGTQAGTSQAGRPGSQQSSQQSQQGGTRNSENQPGRKDGAPTEAQIDQAVESTMPASDPTALQSDRGVPGRHSESGASRTDEATQGRKDRSPDQSLQAGSERTSESAGSGGEGRRTAQ